jgi:hypothetical protein
VTAWPLADAAAQVGYGQCQDRARSRLDQTFRRDPNNAQAIYQAELQRCQNLDAQNQAQQRRDESQREIQQQNQLQQNQLQEQRLQRAREDAARRR